MYSSKSKVLFSRNCNSESQTGLTTILGIKTLNSFGKYLGFSIFHKKLILGDFQFILDNLNSKLVGWKSKFLNMAGRTTLAKSLMSSIPNHVMKFIYLPSKICHLIDKTQRNFIWGTTNSRRRIIWLIGRPLLNLRGKEALACSRLVPKMIPSIVAYLEEYIITLHLSRTESSPSSIILIDTSF